MRSDPTQLLREALGLEALWREEIQRRLKEIDTGAVRMIPRDEARLTLRTQSTR
jgi:hypothetical protein